MTTTPAAAPPGRFNTYVANSPAGCSVANWECLRFTSYVYPNTPLTNAQAAAYTAQGFEVGAAPAERLRRTSRADRRCRPTYTDQLAQWRAKYTGMPAPATNRFHCMVWSDWASQPKTELAHGIRLDTNYYYWPGTLDRRTGRAS